jgi:hypothetical protein
MFAIVKNTIYKEYGIVDLSKTELTEFESVSGDTYATEREAYDKLYGYGAYDEDHAVGIV